MNRTDAVALCRYARAACTGQHFDEYTPDVWFDLLEDLSFEDCHAAIREVVKRQPFVAPAEIRTEVKAVRLKRLTEFDKAAHPYPPPGLTDAEEITWRRELRESVASGHTTAADWQAGKQLTDAEVLREIRERGAA